MDKPYYTYRGVFARDRHYKKGEVVSVRGKASGGLKMFVASKDLKASIRPPSFETDRGWSEPPLKGWSRFVPDVELMAEAVSYSYEAHVKHDVAYSQRPPQSKGQSKRGSMMEVVSSTVSGYSISVLANMYVLPLFDYNVSVSQSMQMGLIFTVISLVRSFCFRRLFNAIQTINEGSRAMPVVVVKCQTFLKKIYKQYIRRGL